MAVDYDRLAATAQRLIGDFGRTFTLRRQGAASDPSKPWAGQSAGATSTLIGVFLDAERSQVTGQVVETGRQLVLVFTETAPQVGDVVDDGGTRYPVQAVNPLQPGDTVLLYELEVSR